MASAGASEGSGEAMTCRMTASTWKVGQVVPTYFVSQKPRRGHYRRLREAVQQVPPYSRIEIVGGGVFRERIVIDKPLEIGASRKGAASAAGGVGDATPVLTFKTTALTITAEEAYIEGLTVEIEDAAAAAFLARRGDARQPHPQQQQQRPAAAADGRAACTTSVLIQTGKPTLQWCSLQAVEVAGKACPTLRECRVADGPMHGLLVSDYAGGQYTKNTIGGHGGFSICVESFGAPSFSYNEIGGSWLGHVCVREPESEGYDGSGGSGASVVAPQFLLNRVSDESSYSAQAAGGQTVAGDRLLALAGGTESSLPAYQLDAMHVKGTGMAVSLMPAGDVFGAFIGKGDPSNGTSGALDLMADLFGPAARAGGGDPFMAAFAVAAPGVSRQQQEQHRYAFQVTGPRAQPTVTRNSIVSCQQHGLLLQGGGGGAYEGNYIAANKGWGVVIVDDVRVMAGADPSSDGPGAKADAHSAARRRTVASSGGPSVFAGADPVFTGNHILGNGGGGARVIHSPATFTDSNLLVNNRGPQLVLETGHRRFTFSRNKVRAEASVGGGSSGGGGRVGVWCRGEGCAGDFSKNEFEGCGVGVWLERLAEPTFTLNTFDGGGIGVSASAGARGRFTSCQFSDLSRAAVVLSTAASPSFVLCRMSACGVGALVTQGGRGHFTGCELRESRLVAMEVSAGGAPTVTECRLQGGNLDGLRVVQQGLGTFTRNVIVGSAVAQVRIAHGGDPTLTENVIGHSSADGVLVEEGGLGTLIGNIVRACYAAGVAVSGAASAPVLRGNYITGCGGYGLSITEGAAGVYERNVIVDHGRACVCVAGQDAAAAAAVAGSSSSTGGGSPSEVAAERAATAAGATASSSGGGGTATAAAAMATLRENVLRGAATGVAVEHGVRLLMAGNIVTQHSQAAVTLRGSSTLTAMKNEFAACPQGIVADEGARLLMYSNTFADIHGGAAVCAHDAVQCEAAWNVFVRCRLGLVLRSVRKGCVSANVFTASVDYAAHLGAGCAAVVARNVFHGNRRGVRLGEALCTARFFDNCLRATRAHAVHLVCGAALGPVAADDRPPPPGTRCFGNTLVSNRVGLLLSAPPAALGAGKGGGGGGGDRLAALQAKPPPPVCTFNLVLNCHTAVMAAGPPSRSNAPGPARARQAASGGPVPVAHLAYTFVSCSSIGVSVACQECGSPGQPAAVTAGSRAVSVWAGASGGGGGPSMVILLTRSLLVGNDIGIMIKGGAEAGGAPVLRAQGCIVANSACMGLYATTARGNRDGAAPQGSGGTAAAGGGSGGGGGGGGGAYGQLPPSLGELEGCLFFKSYVNVVATAGGAPRLSRCVLEAPVAFNCYVTGARSAPCFLRCLLTARAATVAIGADSAAAPAGAQRASAAAAGKKDGGRSRGGYLADASRAAPGAAARWDFSAGPLYGGGDDDGPATSAVAAIRRVVALVTSLLEVAEQTARQGEGGAVSPYRPAAKPSAGAAAPRQRSVISNRGDGDEDEEGEEDHGPLGYLFVLPSLWNDLYAEPAVPVSALGPALPELASSRVSAVGPQSRRSLARPRLTRRSEALGRMPAGLTATGAASDGAASYYSVAAHGEGVGKGDGPALRRHVTPRRSAILWPNNIRGDGRDAADDADADPASPGAGGPYIVLGGPGGPFLLHRVFTGAVARPAAATTSAAAACVNSGRADGAAAYSSSGVWLEDEACPHFELSYLGQHCHLGSTGLRCVGVLGRGGGGGGGGGSALGVEQPQTAPARKAKSKGQGRNAKAKKASRTSLQPARDACPAHPAPPPMPFSRPPLSTGGFRDPRLARLMLAGSPCYWRRLDPNAQLAAFDAALPDDTADVAAAAEAPAGGCGGPPERRKLSDGSTVLYQKLSTRATQGIAGFAVVARDRAAGVFSRCLFERNVRAAQVSSGSRTAFQQCTFQQQTSTSVGLDTRCEALVRGCIFRETRACPIRVSGAGSCPRIEDNEFNEATFTAVEALAGCAPTILRNRLRGIQADAITVRDGAIPVIERNRFDGCRCGLHYHPLGGGKAVGNTFTGSVDFGIQVTHRDVHGGLGAAVSLNGGAAAGRAGPPVTAAADSVKAAKPKKAKRDKTAPSAAAAAAVLEQEEQRAAAERAAAAVMMLRKAAVTAPVIDGNTITGGKNGGIGVTGECACPVVRHNHLAENTLGIVLVDGAGGRYHGNSLLRHHTGLHVYGSAGTFTANTVTDSYVSGVELGGASNAPVLAGNWVGNGRLAGIVVKGGGGQLVRNRVVRNGADGCTIEGASSQPLLFGNSLASNGGYGASILGGCTPQLSCNAVARNQKGGLLVDGGDTRPAMQGNYIKGNRGVGVWFRAKAGGLLDGSVVSSTVAGPAVIVADQARPTLREVAIVGNASGGVVVQPGGACDAVRCLFVRNISDGGDGAAAAAATGGPPPVAAAAFLQASGQPGGTRLVGCIFADNSLALQCDSGATIDVAACAFLVLATPAAGAQTSVRLCHDSSPVFRHTLFVGGRCGVTDLGSTARCSRVIFLDCACGVDVLAGSPSLYECELRGCGVGVRVARGQPSVIGCTFSGQTRAGLQILDEGNPNVEESGFLHNARGISAEGAGSSGRVVHNRLLWNNDNIVVAEGSAVAIDRNLIYDAQSCGVLVRGGRPQITNNDIFDNFSASVSVASGAQVLPGARLECNTISFAREGGALVVQGGASLEAARVFITAGNTVRNNYSPPPNALLVHSSDRQLAYHRVEGDVERNATGYMALRRCIEEIAVAAVGRISRLTAFAVGDGTGGGGGVGGGAQLPERPHNNANAGQPQQHNHHRAGKRGGGDGGTTGSGSPSVTWAHESDNGGPSEVAWLVSDQPPPSTTTTGGHGHGHKAPPSPSASTIVTAATPAQQTSTSAAPSQSLVPLSQDPYLRGRAEHSDGGGPACMDALAATQAADRAAQADYGDGLVSPGAAPAAAAAGRLFLSAVSLEPCTAYTLLFAAKQCLARVLEALLPANAGGGTALAATHSYANLLHRPPHQTVAAMLEDDQELAPMLRQAEQHTQSRWVATRRHTNGAPAPTPAPDGAHRASFVNAAGEAVAPCSELTSPAPGSSRATPRPAVAKRTSSSSGISNIKRSSGASLDALPPINKKFVQTASRPQKTLRV